MRIADVITAKKSGRVDCQTGGWVRCEDWIIVDIDEYVAIP